MIYEEKTIETIPVGPLGLIPLKSCAELGEKGELQVRTVPLRPMRDMREIRGTYMELAARSFYQGLSREDYYHITLTDEEDVRDAVGKLRVIYKNLMKLDYDNLRTRGAGQIRGAERVERKTPLELFEEFYEKQNNQGMSAGQRELVQTMIEKIWGDDR